MNSTCQRNILMIKASGEQKIFQEIHPSQCLEENLHMFWVLQMKFSVKEYKLKQALYPRPQ